MWNKRGSQLNTVHTYFYGTGEQVMEGDVVTSGNHKNAVVEKIIMPESFDAEAFSCPNGGILLREDWDGKPSLLLIRRDDVEELQDTRFIRRGVVA